MQTIRKDLYDLINAIPDEGLQMAADCLKVLVNKYNTSDPENSVAINKEEIYPLELISQMAFDMGYDDLSENFDFYTRRRVVADE
ncbi:MAG: hypothetical protein ABRQ39_01020 [Candidatus Eremiobacterota bacterium]